MKTKLFLLRCQISFFFFDCLYWPFDRDWNKLRRESRASYRLIKLCIDKK